MTLEYIGLIAIFSDEVSAEKSDLTTVLSALSALFCAAFALGWFEYYFMHTFQLYLIAIAVAILLIFMVKLRIRK